MHVVSLHCTAGTGQGWPWCAGFHLYRRQLDAMPDPALAHAKRGAHWTFDPARFVHHLQRLRQGGGALS